ncbi:3-keto-5-aminohexanoate cleavage protein [Enterococcus sp. 5H]|uniref:3-keto-5-aminohexanoate cleavage protein n=1 Tax=Enterococcus sp. 5H TaxID=1229490 RepID=UPI002303E3D3|nr:3-keto-5-aminohexanoate cleavage protein [Enterococcus sp. 5H]MDA9470712.1 3-keto-5-aminohexanoate cleavage enzyme [Enterococcus sp. 5H]
MSNKVVITVATTGGFTTRENNPNVPLTPVEIADEVYKCYQAGAAIAHIHVRDEAGNATMDFEKFKETVTLIRAKCDIVINITTSGGIGFNDDERMKPFVELLPEIASYDCGTMNWQHSTVFENTPAFLEKAGKKMQEVNVKPEIEVFDPGMLYTALYYVKKGILKEPLHFQFVLGAPGGIAATVENLVYLKSLLPENATWSAFGIGKESTPILMATLALGGNVRVGMEDNSYLFRGQLAESNVQFVERAKNLIAELGKEIATPDEARQLLGLVKKV